MTALADLDVLDVTEGHGSYAGKLLADLGANVIKVERPGGDPARGIPPHTTADQDPDASAFFGFLNTSKRGIVLNPAVVEDCRTLESLVASVDVVFEDHLPAYGLDPQTVPDDHPDTVVVSITGFGRTGPFADYESVDLIEAAMSGMSYQTGYPDRPPTRPGLSICSYFGATYAAIGALVAAAAVDEIGGQHVDISKQEAIAANLEATNMDYAYNGEIEYRAGSKHPGSHPGGEIFPVTDGYVCVNLAGQPTDGPLGGRDTGMWLAFCDLLDREDLLYDERFNPTEDDQLSGGAKRREHAAAVNKIIEEELKTADWEKDEFYHVSQDRGMANAPLSTAADLFDSDQLAARGFLEPVSMPNGDEVTMPTAPYRLSETPVSIERAPLLDEHGDEVRAGLADTSPSNGTPGGDRGEVADGPLDSVRVLDFTMVWAGPHCTAVLADHGADVIKVESIERPDGVRAGRPRYENDVGDPEHGEDRSGWFQQENRNKRSLTVNLQTDEGKALIREIVAEGDVDVVVESFTPGVMDRLGLGYDDLRERNEELVMCSLSGYGQEGPESRYRAYGPMLEAHSGIAHVTGFPEDRPVRTGISFTDPMAGLNGALAILAALHHRDRIGQGQYIDLSQMESGAMLTHPAITTYDVTGEVVNRVGNRDEHGRFVQGVYRCAKTEDRDDLEEWVALAIRHGRDWEAFTGVVDEEWTAEERFATQSARLSHHDALDEHVERWTRERDRYEVMDRLQAAGVPAGVVQTTKDILENDAGLDARGFWETVDHPVIGPHPYPGAVPTLSETPGRIRRHAPMLGQHTREVLYDLLDIDGERVGELEEKGVLK